MRLFKDYFLVGLTVITAIILYTTLYQMASRTDQPLAQSGVLQLTEENWNKHDLFQLDGEWSFFPNQLLTPQEIAMQDTASGTFIQVPGNWNGQSLANGVEMNGKGFGTYRLLVEGVPTDRQLAISKRYIRFADALFVDGKQLGQSGTPSADPTLYEPRNMPYTTYFFAEKPELEIVIQVANYEYRDGGILSTIEFGSGQQIDGKIKHQTGLEYMIISFMIAFSLLFFYSYLFIHKDVKVLLQAIFFFFFAVIIFSNGERLLLQLFHDLSFEPAFKIKYISLYGITIIIYQIMTRIVESRKMKRLLHASTALIVIYVVTILTTPFRVYSYAQDVVYVWGLVMYVIILAHLFRMYLLRQYGTINLRQFQILIASIWILLLNSILSILSTWNMIAMTLVNGLFIMQLISFAILLVYQYGQAYNGMQQLTGKLQIADQMKDEFLLLTSHELNTPLHGIIHVSRSLLETPLKKANEYEIQQKLNRIRNTAYRMSNTVHDLIDASRFKDGSLNITIGTVDLVPSLSVVMEVFTTLATGKGVCLRQHVQQDARYVSADSNRLMQVLYNIMYILMDAHAQDEIVLETKRSGRHVILSVGFEKNESDSRSQVTSSSLPSRESAHAIDARLELSRELVQRMGGELVMDESNTWVKLYLSAVDHPIEEETPDENNQENLSLAMHNTAYDGMEYPTSKAVTILLATTNLIDLEYLYGLLTMEGFQIKTAATSAEVMKTISSRERPDLMMIDVQLPPHNGYTLCRELRKDFSQAELPVLFINTRSTPADIETCIAAQGNDFIHRPLDTSEILVRVHTLLGMKKLVKEAASHEMAFLRSQIKPHFLYNALATIMSLCYTDGPRAGELLGSFSRYLRILFHSDSSDDMIPLSTEMELIGAYVDIEMVRFGSRLTVEIDADPSLYACKVMPLLIEPLVENAIRHGVSKKISGGTVKLTIKRQEQSVIVIVQDDGVGMTAEQVSAMYERKTPDQGIGLQNLIRRMKHLNGQIPHIASMPGQGTTVTIQFPYMI
ncbi:histidine kinase [Paenibacillus paeoniae]|uniref:histidine kinase n=1 Tax=Paenibacillus paeoniae TaxID=2292705 RepID=A0A371PKW5_9BACL|nr:histidine kinase [Paenibacillus paeoniae]REK76842.1 response regulator [Paenibacillus paeoniae]